MKKLIITFLIISFFLIGCGSLKYENFSKEPTQETNLIGKTVGIPLFPVEFSPFRFILIDQTTVKVNDVPISTKYRSREEDDMIGTVGILLINGCKEIGMKIQPFQTTAQEKFAGYLMGNENYHVPWVKGFGPGGMGELSSAPIEYDRTVFPPEVIYLENPNDNQFAKNVVTINKVVTYGNMESEIAQLNSDLKVDYYITGKIDIKSEAFEVLEPSGSSYNDDNGMWDEYKQGDFFFQYTVILAWNLVDAATSEIILDDVNAKSEYTTTGNVNRSFKLPVKPGDFEAFKKYMKSADFTQRITKDLETQIAASIQHFISYNVYTSVAAE